MKKSFLFPVLLLAFSPGLRAALEKDLGSGLVYLRVLDATADADAVVSAIDSKPSLVLDLRSLPEASGLAEILPSALAKSAPARGVRLVLINSTTAPALVAALAHPLPSVVTVGPLSPALSPDVAVKTSEEADRRAYAALTDSTAVETVLNGNRDKRRYDEAKLMHDHANGVAAQEEPEPAEDDPADSPPADGSKAATATTDKKNAPPPPPIDQVLQRAVHLYRALLTLKKL